MVSVPFTPQPYPEEFRREACRARAHGSRSFRDLAKSLGASQQSLRAVSGATG